VYLNADSKITYSRDFNRKNRSVNLTGEAFFEVAPDKNHPFVIHADNADIRVVGTSFNVRATPADHHVEVYVSTGVVEMFPSGQSESLVTLRPGDIGMVANRKASSRKSRNANAIAWKTGEMDFRDTRLSDAISVLNGLYRVNIVCVEPGLDTTLTNGTYRYPDESLEQILTILCTQNNMKARNEDNTIYLSR
jgi:ferric-dicitrate binding protein FerR (iron transport regulator)